MQEVVMPIKMYNFGYAKDLPRIIEIDKSGLDVAGLLDCLETEYGSKIKGLVVKSGEIDTRTRIAVNGNIVFKLNTPIPDGAEVLISNIMAGG